MFTLVFIVYTVTANALGHLLFNNITYLAFEPLGKIPLKAVGFYMVLQGIFLVGAVHFRGYVFPKTIFTLLLFGMVCGIIFYLIMANMFHSDITCTPECNPMKDKTLYQIWMVVQWLFRWVMAPLCWVITYIGLKEQEV
jgi:hypothetical protein